MMMIIITRYPASEDRLIVRPLLSRVCALRLQPAEPQPYTLVTEALMICLGVLVACDVDERAKIRAARFPKHRFLGLRTPAGAAGYLWTRPFVLGGTEIRVDAQIDGSLRAELCEPFGRPLPGFTKANSSVISGDSTGHVLSWKGADLRHYVHNAVSLRLEVERGRVFNIHWT